MKKIIENLAAFILIPAIVLFGLNGFIDRFAGKKIGTYYDGQTQDVLGRPVPKKKPNEYRVFIFGGSSAYGFPVADRYSIAAWLRKSFPHLLPGKIVHVLNCAWPGKGSHHDLEGAHSVMKYKPDLFIVYTGHNEAHLDNRLFVDFWFYKLDLMLRFRCALYKYMMRYFNKLRKLITYGNSKHVEKQYREEVIAAKIYSRADVDDAAYGKILDAYSKNIQKIIDVAKRHGVKVIITNLPSNIRRIPPFMSSHRPDLSAQDLAAWDKLYQDALAAQEKGEHKAALDLFSQAAQIDGAYADVHYKQGQSHEALGQFDEAKSAYLRALELDTLPSRAKMSMSEAARRIAIENGVWFVDFIAALEKTSAYGIISSEMIYDDVHPSITAQQIMTEAILRELSLKNWALPAEEWKWDTLEKAMSDTASEDWKIDGSLNAYQFVLRGLKLWEQKRFEESSEDLAKGLEHMPAFVESYAFLADSQFRLGHEDEARRAFMKLADANPVLLNFLTKKYPDISESYSAIMKASAAA